MDIVKKYRVATLSGALYAGLLIFLSRWLLRSFSAIAGYICAALELEEALAQQIYLAFDQLRAAQIQSPWFIALILGALTGILLHKLIRNRTARIVICIIFGILLLIPLTLTVAYYTKVNSILVGKLVQCLIPLLSALL